MSLEVKVTRVSEGQTQKGKPKTGLYDGKAWVNVFGHFGAKVGDTAVVKPSGIANWYEFEFMKDAAPPQLTHTPSMDNPPDDEPQRGPLQWPEYVSLVEKAHQLANKLEPDIISPDYPTVDRAPARHAILATILISYGRGNFEYPEIPFIFILALSCLFGGLVA